MSTLAEAIATIAQQRAEIERLNLCCNEALRDLRAASTEIERLRLERDEAKEANAAFVADAVRHYKKLSAARALLERWAKEPDRAVPIYLIDDTRAFLDALKGG